MKSQSIHAKVEQAGEHIVMRCFEPRNSSMVCAHASVLCVAAAVLMSERARLVADFCGVRYPSEARVGASGNGHELALRCLGP